jgi:hypothetical protein
VQQIVADIRRELAEAGIEFTAKDLDEILNLAASLAASLGGHVYFDCGDFWGIEVTIDEAVDPSGATCQVMVVYFDEEDEDAGFSDGELLN